MIFQNVCEVLIIVLEFGLKDCYNLGNRDCMNKKRLSRKFVICPSKCVFDIFYKLLKRLARAVCMKTKIIIVNSRDKCVY